MRALSVNCFDGGKRRSSLRRDSMRSDMRGWCAEGPPPGKRHEPRGPREPVRPRCECGRERCKRCDGRTFLRADARRHPWQPRPFSAAFSQGSAVGALAARSARPLLDSKSPRMSSARRAPLFMWSVGMVVAGAVSVTVAACGSDGLSDGANNHGLDGAVVSGCSGAPQTACPCSSEGQAVDCGYVKEQSGNYLTCAAGSRTCAGGAWGPCVATGTVFQSLGPLGGDGNGGGGVHVESLGMNSDAGDAGDAGQTNCTDPCDPSCQTFVDNSNGVDGGPTVVPTEAGGWALPGQTIDAASTCFVTLTGTVKDPA